MFSYSIDGYHLVDNSPTNLWLCYPQNSSTPIMFTLHNSKWVVLSNEDCNKFSVLPIEIAIWADNIITEIEDGIQSNNNLHGTEIPNGQPVQVVQL